MESIKRQRKDSSAVSTVWYICIYLRDISKVTFIYLFSRLFIWFFSLHLSYYSVKLYKQFYSLSKFHYRIAVRFIGIRQSQAPTRRALNIQGISNDPLYPINQNNNKITLKKKDKNLNDSLSEITLITVRHDTNQTHSFHRCSLSLIILRLSTKQETYHFWKVTLSYEIECDKIEGFSMNAKLTKSTN